ETAMYGKIWDNEDVHDLRSIKTEFPAIVFNDTLTSEATLSCEPTNEFPSIVYNDAQTSKLDDLDYFKDFENEFPAIVYNDAQINYGVLVKDSKRIVFWSLNEDILKITILRQLRCIHQGEDMRYPWHWHALTKDHSGIKLNTTYPEDSIRRIQNMESI
ncbi:hypothetical protein Tco_0905913, partial [Tanacetum coccineum]